MTSAQDVPRKSRIIPILKEVFEEASGNEVNGDLTTTFLEMGMDSLFLTQVSMALSKKFKVKITFRQLLEEYTNLDQLSQFIDSALPAEALPVQKTESSSTAVTPAAAPSDGRASVVVPPKANVPRMMPAFTASSPSAPAGALEQLISQQLELMARQIELLGGGAVVPDALPAASPAAELPSNASEAQSAAVSTPAEVTTAPTPSNAAAPSPAAAETGEKKAFVGPQLKITKSQTTALTAKQKQHVDALIQRYNGRTKGSKAFAQAHRAHLADPRVVAGFKPLLKEIVYPLVVNRSQGSKLWDIDGNEYVDMLNGFGSNYFGHRAPFVIEALERQLKIGIEIGPQHPLAGQLAEELSAFLGHDRVAFCNTGSEAVLGAMRIARTITGRDLIAMFTGAYHGIFDEVIVRGTRSQRSVPASPGIQPGAVSNILVLDYATDETLKILKQRAGELAAILVEPVQSRMPELQPREFLHELRALTQQSGTALIFDEVVTGFRAGPQGAQGHFGLKADIATYGKVLGGGMNIGVIAGSSRFMDALDGGAWQFGDESVPEVGVTYFAGTFVRHPPALVAAKAVLDHVKAEGPDLQRRVNEKTARLVNEINAYAERIRVPVKLTHFTSVIRVAFTQDVALGELLFAHLREKGVHIWDHRPVYMTAAHTDEDVAFVIDAFKRSLDEMKQGDILPES
jgi:glutamate-1-semialdehyde aminotransferase/acyl carrier protein